jgi:accessory colonization factor AcfC
MSKLRVSIAIQSHLSDAMMEMSFNPEQAERRIQFVKWLVNIYPDTNSYVDEDALNAIYRDKVLKLTPEQIS